MSSSNQKILKAVSDPSRYRILRLLIENEGTICVNEIADKVKITPSAVSHQLSKLEDLQLIEPNRSGQNICYTLKRNKNSEKIRMIIDLLET